jgi:dTDP-4-dehydrorhamnose 3,5-epimerase
MHLQVPPAANTKCVYCVSGAVLDVVLDVRPTSPAYGQFFARELNGESREMLFIPVGCAHGFLSLTEDALMFYQSDVPYAPNQDAGVRWDSFGYKWPIADPILSARDQALPPLAEFACH